MFRILLFLLAPCISLSAATRPFQTFEGDGFGDWKIAGIAFGLAPVAGKSDSMDAPFTSYSDESLAASSNGDESATGTLTSPEFAISEPYVVFLIAGGDSVGSTAAQLVVDGKVVRESVGKRRLNLERTFWDVREFTGSRAVIRLVDRATGPWGFIAVDHIIFSDSANFKFPAPTREGQPYFEGLVRTEVVPGANIPGKTQLKIEATHEGQRLNSPTAITFDEQGRIYISESHRFREGVEDARDTLFWYLDDLASKTTADRRALHEKWKEKVPLETLTRQSEKIRRFADTDGDGTLDESKIFAEGFNDVLDGTGAGVFYYEGSLYFACIPKIHVLRDPDGDGMAEDRKVVEEGFGVRISLSGHDLNGFALGPDGRIYGTIGDRGLSVITKEDVNYQYPDQGVAFRFEPDGSGFEIFHTGLRNPKEIAFDAAGNPFTVDNNSDQGDAARIVYLVEGGDSGWRMEHQAMHTFHRQIGLPDHPPSRWMDEKMWEMPSNVQPAFMLPPSAHLTSGPSGLTYHPGAGFLESEANHFFICDYRGASANSGIWSFEMAPKGAGMELKESHPLAWGIAATDVEFSWDGKLFITDFMGGWKTHDEGRLLSLDAGDQAWRREDADSAARLMKNGFESRSSAVLLNLLKHPDFRIRLRAQLALTRKSDAIARFSEATLSAELQVKIHGIWGLGIVARRGAALLPESEFAEIPNVRTQLDAETKLITFLDDKDPEVRAQALRMLADAPSNKITLPLAKLLVDESPRVRFFAALVVGKRKLVSFYGPVCDLIQQNDNRDAYLRHAGIYALQHMSSNPAILTALVLHPSAAVRLAAVVALRRLQNPSIASFIRDAEPAIADEAIRAITDLDLSRQRESVARLLDESTTRQWSPFMWRRLIHNSFRLGDAKNARRVSDVAANSSLPNEVRLEAFRLLKEWLKPHPVDQLTGQWRPLEPRKPDSLHPVLLEKIPELLQRTDFTLTAALELIAQEGLTIPALTDKAVRAIISNPDSPANARAIALEILTQRNSADLDSFLIPLAVDPAEPVAFAALNALALRSPQTVLPILESAIANPSLTRSQKIWPLLAKLPGENVDALFVRNLDQLRSNNGISPFAIELLEAAGERRSDSVVRALVAYNESLKQNTDSLARWNSALEGGDAEVGFQLFASHPAADCMRCHRADTGHVAGGETAPNLADIASRHPNKRDFIESLIQPSAKIVPGFGAVLIDFHNGTTISGNLISETSEHLDIDSDGKPLRILRPKIKLVTTPVSPMPAMEALLEPREVRDLVAWLGSLDQKVPARKSLEPVIFDPDASPQTSPAVADSSAQADVSLLKLGRQQYILCAACHGQSGEGNSVGPPIAGSEWVTGPPENLIRIQLRGLHGPIRVKGVEYNSPGGMAPLAYQTDEQIAAVLTYIRNSFGNQASPISPAAVAALRSEVGKPMLTASDLIPPISQPTPVPFSNPPPPERPKSSKPPASPPLQGKWIAIAVGIFVIGTLARAFRKAKE